VVRRALPFLLLATLLVGGCGYGESADLTSAQKQARVEFLKQVDQFDDHELARLCPGLYPRDFNTNDDAGYPREDKDHRNPTVTPELRAAARAAGCDVPSPE
jgi:hypothetical protein